MTRLFRVLAILIALAAAIDPVVTTNRASKPVVSVVAATPNDSALADVVARQVGRSYTVIRVPFAKAAATIIAGDAASLMNAELARPVFSVTRDTTGGSVAIEHISAPTHAPLAARVSVSLSARIDGGSKKKAEFTLMLGDVVVDRVTRDIATASERAAVTLTYVPTAEGTVNLRVKARIEGSAYFAMADTPVEIRQKRWAVLFFDPRPSWMSTFVRRAVEQDPRFVVSSRVVTSRNISTDVGRPPAALDHLPDIDLYDAIVVGAPEGMSDRDVAGIEAFMRRRAGGVVLLLDQHVTGAYERLTHVARWSTTTRGQAFRIDPADPGAHDGGALRASEIAWPADLPEGASPIAESASGSGDTTQRRPIVWRAPVGAGRLVVSGAMDAWTNRATPSLSFDTFWRALLAETADAGASLVDVRPARSAYAPGERGEVVVTLRDAALSSASGARARVSGTMDHGGMSEPLSIWPEGAPGVLRAGFRVPATPGVYRISAIADGARGDATIIVDASASPVRTIAPQVSAVWVRTHGGSARTERELPDVISALSRAVRADVQRTPWHPMRSLWWIVPFAAALGAEWWIRRRRGLA